MFKEEDFEELLQSETYIGAFSEKGFAPGGAFTEKRFEGGAFSNLQLDEREQVYAELIKRHGHIIRKYGLAEFIYSYSEEKLIILGQLLTEIEPLIIFDLYDPTGIVPNGKRYNAKIGKNRLVIIDATNSDPRSNHLMAISLEPPYLLNFLNYRSDEEDREFEKYRIEQKKVMVPPQNQTPVVTAEAPVVKKAEKKPSEGFKSDFWYNNPQLLAIFKQDKEHGTPIGYNQENKKSPSGKAVGLIQFALNVLVPDVKIKKEESNGDIFGPSTMSAVKAFQKKNGLKEDGIVGHITIAAMDEALFEFVQRNKQLHDLARQKSAQARAEEKKAEAEKAEREKIRLNSQGNVIYPIPELNTSLLKQEGIDPSKLKFKYHEQPEYNEIAFIHGVRYDVSYDDVFIGVIDVALKISLEGGRKNNQFFINAYSGNYPVLYGMIESGDVYEIKYGPGIGGDPDLIDIVGRLGFKGYYGSSLNFETIAGLAFSEGVAHVSVEGMRTMPKSGNIRAGNATEFPERIEIKQSAEKTESKSKEKVEQNQKKPVPIEDKKTFEFKQASEEERTKTEALKKEKIEEQQKNAKFKAQAADLDKDGGHGNADHGPQTTKEQQVKRLRTGETPGGRQADIPEAASKFDSNEKQIGAYTDALEKLETEKFKTNGALKVKVAIKKAPFPNCGISYSLDAEGNVVETRCNSYTAIFQLNRETNTYKLVTLYPEK